MNYKVYKLDFRGTIHLGKSSLEDGEYTFCADTLFSALCHEAVKLGEDGIEKLYKYVMDGKLLFSDAFPYEGKNYYLPKPMLHIESQNEKGNSIVKKAYKKLKYIPVTQIENYLNGTYDVLHTDSLKELGHFEMKVSASIRGEEETKPYRIGCYRFNEGNGLYIIVAYESDEILEFTEKLLENLSYSGIGGKRASGMGRFVLLYGKLDENVEKRLNNKECNKYMTLSVSLPKEDELEKALEDAEYSLIRRSGFVLSDTYSSEQMRKKDLYVLKAGACVNTCYEGNVYDVSDKPGKHPVYKYAKPLFLGVDV